MAFPASAVTTRQAWEKIQSGAIRMRNDVQQLRDLSAAGATGRSSYLSLQRKIDTTVDEWNSLSSTSIGATDTVSITSLTYTQPTS